MKAHGIHDKATPVREIPVSPCRKATTERTGSNKKTKLSHFSETNTTAADDDEGLTRVKGEVENTMVKNEPVLDGELLVASSGFSYQPVDLETAEKADDGSIFNDFLQVGAYDSSVLMPQSSYRVVNQSDTDGMPSTSFRATGHAMHDTILITD